jgi:hypothetical protein
MSHFVRIIRKRWRFAFVILTLSLAAGCGASNGEVTGTVSYNGSNLKGGTISFVSASGGQSITAPIQQDGTYKIEKMPTGEVKVVVETKSLEKRASAHEYSPPSDAVGTKGFHAHDGREFVAIPRKYEILESTDLTYTVVKGKQKKDFTLEGMVMPTKDPNKYGGTYKPPARGSYGPPKQGSDGRPPQDMNE